MSLRFDVNPAFILKTPPQQVYQIFHEGSHTLDCFTIDPEGHPDSNLVIDDEHAFQAYRPFEIGHLEKKQVVRHFRWRGKAAESKPYSSFISISDDFNRTQVRLQKHCRDWTRKWISVAVINTPELIPAVYVNSALEEILVFVEAFVKPDDGQSITEAQFNSTGAQCWVSDTQLVRDQSWNWMQVHTERDEWLLGGGILEGEIANVIPFNGNEGRGGRRLVFYNEKLVPVVQCEGKTFDYDTQQWRWLDEKKRKCAEVGYELDDSDGSDCRQFKKTRYTKYVTDSEDESRTEDCESRERNDASECSNRRIRSTDENGEKGK